MHRENCQMPGAQLPGQGRLPWLLAVLAAAGRGEVLLQQVSLDSDGRRSLPCRAGMHLLYSLSIPGSVLFSPPWAQGCLPAHVPGEPSTAISEDPTTMSTPWAAALPCFETAPHLHNRSLSDGEGLHVPVCASPFLEYQENILGIA